MKGKIIDFCDPNHQEKREDFWMRKLRKLYPKGLNIKFHLQFIEHSSTRLVNEKNLKNIYNHVEPIFLAPQVK